ncbi:MAG: hypothetical protein ACUVRM_04065 [Bacillota bacterium]
MKEKKTEKREKRPRMGEEELRKRLALDAMSDPGGIDTALTLIGRPIGPAGTHLAEERDEKE